MTKFVLHYDISSAHCRGRARGLRTDEWPAQHAAGELARVGEGLEQQRPVPRQAHREAADGHYQALPRVRSPGRRVPPRQRRVAAPAAHVLRYHPRQRLQPPAQTTRVPWFNSQKGMMSDDPVPKVAHAEGTRLHVLSYAPGPFQI